MSDDSDEEYAGHCRVCEHDVGTENGRLPNYCGSCGAPFRGPDETVDEAFMRIAENHPTETRKKQMQAAAFGDIAYVYKRTGRPTRGEPLDERLKRFYEEHGHE